MKKKESNDMIIDLTSFGGADANKRDYICSSESCCNNTKLIDYPQAKIDNPFAGPSYRCPSCNRIYDSSLEKLPRAPNKIMSSLDQQQDSSDFIIDTITEDREFSAITDEYAEYDPEGDTDERMQREGWHIVESKIELTDSSGRNRTIVRRSGDRRPKIM